MILQPAKPAVAGRRPSDDRAGRSGQPGAAAGTDSQAAQERIEPVLLVHGTFANERRADSLDWWQPGSAYAQQLDHLLHDAGSPARTWLHLKLPALPRAGMTGPGGVGPHPPPFAWSGANTESERLRAGRALAEQLAGLEQDPRIHRYHLVAHSHGGNVVLNALSELPTAPTKLGALLTLGTPVLRFRHRQSWDMRWVTLPSYAALAVGAAGWAWSDVRWQTQGWVFAACAALAFLADLAWARSPAAARRNQGGLNWYGTGLVHAFVFEGDEAVDALLRAQEIANEPLRFVRQFAAQKTLAPLAVAATESRSRTFEDRLRDSGVYRLLDLIKQGWPDERPWKPAPWVMAPRHPAAGHVASTGTPPAAPTATATAPDKPEPARWIVKPRPAGDSPWRAVWPVIELLLNLTPVIRPALEVTLLLLVMLPILAVDVLRWLVTGISAGVSRVVGVAMAWGAQRLAAKALPTLIRAGVLGADNGHFVAVQALPPGVTAAHICSKELTAEVQALRRQLGGLAGGSLLGALGAQDAFSIKVYVENALSDARLVHSHYYQSRELLEICARLIATAQPQTPETAAARMRLAGRTLVERALGAEPATTAPATTATTAPPPTGPPAFVDPPGKKGDATR